MRNLIWLYCSMTSTALAFSLAGCASIPQFSARNTATPNPKTAQQYLAARNLETQGKFEEAREKYEELLAKNPNNPDYLHRQAVVNTRLQRYGEAKSLFERAKKRDPQNADLLTDIGYTACLRGDYAEAERVLRDAVHLKPSDKRANSNLALALGMQGKTEECLSVLKQTGDEATALCGLAYIYAQRGERELAEQKYREALELDPTCTDASRAISSLAKRKRPADQSFAISEVGKQFEESEGSDDSLTSATIKVASFEESTVNNTVEISDASEPRLTATSQVSTGRVTLSDDPDPSDTDETQTEQMIAESSRSIDDTVISGDDWAEPLTAAEPAKKLMETKPEPATEISSDEWLSADTEDKPAESALSFRPATPSDETSDQSLNAKPNAESATNDDDDDWE